MDVDELNITVKSGPAAGSASKGRGKGRARAEGTEILSDAKLKLQAGQRYALLGRNGSGKSSKIDIRAYSWHGLTYTAHR